MLGDFKESMELWLVKVKHRYDDDYSVLGIFQSESDIEVGKNLYLENKENAGLDKKDFSFSVSKHILGDIEY